MQKAALQKVHLTDPLWIEAMNKNFTFLSEMDDERVEGCALEMLEEYVL